MSHPKHTPRDLKPGEWQLFCNQCGFTYDKCTAAKPVCPECHADLFIAYEEKTKVAT